jgi:hypothetical protein
VRANRLRDDLVTDASFSSPTLAGHEAALSSNSDGATKPVPSPGASAPTVPNAPTATATAERDATREPAVSPDPFDVAGHYTEAERWMTVDRARARAALNALIVRAPLTAEAAQALLDLAMLEARANDRSAARAHLDRLAIHPQGVALAMPAASVRCRIERDPAVRRACLVAFRIRFSGSPIDADALAHLAAAFAASGNCRAAVPLFDEYQSRYRSGPDAAALATWRARCAAPK